MISTNTMSTAARGLIAVTTETRLLAATTEPPRLDVERAHQFALGEADEVAAVDDVGAMILKPRAGARQPRDAPGERQHVGNQRAAADRGRRFR